LIRTSSCFKLTIIKYNMLEAYFEHLWVWNLQLLIELLEKEQESFVWDS